MRIDENCQDDSCTVDSMPDIANEPHSGPNAPLNWVGMSEIEVPVFVVNGQGEKIQTISKVQAYVNLVDPNSKGIHMSRLYLAVDQKLGMGLLSPDLLEDIVTGFVQSHEGISTNAYLECRFHFFEKRKSLLSDNHGWKNYRVRVIASYREGEVCTEMTLEVPYSSTCPCSAALSRQLIQQGFKEQFGEQGQVDIDNVHAWLGTTEGIRATPHSQRSLAQVRVKLNRAIKDLPFSRLIDEVENALQTPVQAVVKREDEQEFARLNAQNLMFCEDAARRLQAALDKDQTLKDFWIRVNHMESLHPHDAVAVVVKGVDGGYWDDPREFPGR
jgi:GTP cyclohydrolase I